MNFYLKRKERNKIILDNFSNADRQISLDKLKTLSCEWKVPLLTFENRMDTCGDKVYFIVKLENNAIKEIYFSAHEACIIATSSSNILCCYLKNIDSISACSILKNCRMMLQSENYNLDNFPKLKAFADIPKIPHRLECINIVINGIANIIDCKTAALEDK